MAPRTTLNNSEMATIASHIRANADPTVVAKVAIRDMPSVASWYAENSTFIVWRTYVAQETIDESVQWSEVSALSVGKARIWEWVTEMCNDGFNPSLSNVRAGLAECWTAASPTRTNLLAASKRPANKMEAIFATGSGTTASPGDLVIESVPTGFMFNEALNRY
jgi:hypothetical protein